MTITRTFTSRWRMPDYVVDQTYIDATDFLRSRRWRRALGLSRIEMKAAIRKARHIIESYRTCRHCGQLRLRHVKGKCLFEATFFAGTDSVEKEWTVIDITRRRSPRDFPSFLTPKHVGGRLSRP